MKRIRILVFILCACSVSSAWGQQAAFCKGCNWRQFHRLDMSRWNRYEKVLNVHNVGTLGLKWSFKTGGVVYSSPAVAHGVVYVGANWPDDHVYALNAKTGTKFWSYTSGSYVESSTAVANGVVYVGLGYDVYALNARTGAKLWSYTTGYWVFSSPAVVNGVVYGGSGYDYNVYALNAKTGALLWSYTTGYFEDSAPAVAKGVVYVGSADDKVYAFGLKKGRE